MNKSLDNCCVSVDAPPELPKPEIDRAIARKSTPECSIKRSSSVAIKASMTYGEISLYLTLILLISQNLPIIVSSLLLFFANTVEACASGGLSNKATVGKLLSGCNNSKEETKRKGNNIIIQKDIINFFWVSFETDTVDFFIFIY